MLCRGRLLQCDETKMREQLLMDIVHNPSTDEMLDFLLLTLQRNNN